MPYVDNLTANTNASHHWKAAFCRILSATSLCSVLPDWAVFLPIGLILNMLGWKETTLGGLLQFVPLSHHLASL